MELRWIRPTALCLLLVLSALDTAQATTLYLSTNTTATLGGLTFADKDVVALDLGTGIATSFFKATDATPALTSSPKDTDIDALHLLPNGHIVLSVTHYASSIAGLSFNDDDLIDYDPVANTAVKIFDGTTMFPDTAFDEDINAAFIRGNGNIVFSTNNSNTIGGLNFRDKDIVEYNPVTDTASLLFNGDIISATGNYDTDVDAVHLLGDGSILFSTRTPGSFVGGHGGNLAFDDGDVVRYDPATDSASLFFHDADFVSANYDINAIYVATPEPGTAALLALALALVAMTGIAQRRTRPAAG